MLFDIKPKKEIKTIAYGCIISNNKMKPEETILYKELKDMFHADKTYVEIAFAYVKRRPILNEIIEELNSGDRIYISDITDLFGVTNKAKFYYKKAIEKGIELLILDHNHSLFHLHPLSFLPLISNGKKEINDLLNDFDRYEKLHFKTETNRRKRHNFDFSLQWKKMYFDYESYQIDHFELLKRAKELGFNNHPTLMSHVAEYERSIEFQKDVINYTRIDPDFLKTPKRIINRSKGQYLLPDEYLFIKKSMQDDLVNIDITKNNFDKQSYITKHSLENNFLINNVIFERYRLLETMRIPRKLRENVGIHFEETSKNSKGECL